MRGVRYFTSVFSPNHHGVTVSRAVASSALMRSGTVAWSLDCAPPAAHLTLRH